MALADRLAKPISRVSPQRPAMDTWLDSLTPEDREAVDAALRDRGWASKHLLRELQAEGAPSIAESTFDKWRRDHVAR
ncbi:hypothetical protein [Nesterenkonia sp.]|uniref:hypothetical protein n=1 Tax=Nesterenkonia sp. TaxID=704201 RepID=UPI00263A3A82|nr:hypothetical protein [Nesterenkonia sp.]